MTVSELKEKVARLNGEEFADFLTEHEEEIKELREQAGAEVIEILKEPTFKYVAKTLYLTDEEKAELRKLFDKIHEPDLTEEDQVKLQRAWTGFIASRVLPSTNENDRE